ncbi:putative lrr receptor-like serine/threonine-protein kinase [Quercus suber]|uniref:Lrr receptor-like serine/threonine-protein kinase n=1 Tax=Quercus suber TaxID=58331 RepID=A0AAW0JUK5_QUESU
MGRIYIHPRLVDQIDRYNIMNVQWSVVAYFETGIEFMGWERGLDLHAGFFTYRQIKAATNFNAANKIREGGFGSVYKLSHFLQNQSKEVVNLLFGCCIEREQLLLVYEYMENNSLAHALFGKSEKAISIILGMIEKATKFYKGFRSANQKQLEDRDRLLQVVRLDNTILLFLALLNEEKS